MRYNTHRKNDEPHSLARVEIGQPPVPYTGVIRRCNVAHLRGGDATKGGRYVLLNVISVLGFVISCVGTVLAILDYKKDKK